MSYAEALEAAAAEKNIVLDQEDVTELFNWHGGQGSAVYSLASTGLNHRVSVVMIEEAIGELERDLTRERHYLQPGELARRDREDVERNVASLEKLIDNLEVTRLMGAYEEDMREGNPITKERAKELIAEARAKGVALGRRGLARGKELAGRASVELGGQLRKLKENHVKTVNGETCVCGKLPGRKENPAGRSRRKLTGYAAIRYAENNGETLNAYANEEHGSLRGLSIEEAQAIEQDDPSLIWIYADRLDNPARSVSEDVQQAGEMLAIAVTSEGTLYPVRKQIEEQLKRKMEKGTYSRERAPQAFAFYVEEGAKLLAKENRDSDKRPWFDQYPAAVRRIAAADIAESVEAELRIAMREGGRDLCKICGEDRNRPSQHGAHDCTGSQRRDNPIYPALGPAPERRSNPTSSGGESVPLKLLQPEVGGTRAVNPVRQSGRNVSETALAEMEAEAWQKGSDDARVEKRNQQRAPSAADQRLNLTRRLLAGEFRVPPPRTAAWKKVWTAYQDGRAGRKQNPLKGGCSGETISANIEHELHKHPEMPVAQGAAIAYSHARAQGCKLPARRKHNPTDDTAVADTILNQMGGMRTLSVMVGAKNFVALENGVQFSIGSGAKDGINKVRVVLRPSDTYDVEFWKVRGTSMKKVSEWGDVYNDQLMDLFEKETGMYLTMTRRKNGEAAS